MMANVRTSDWRHGGFGVACRPCRRGRAERSRARQGGRGDPRRPGRGGRAPTRMDRAADHRQHGTSTTRRAPTTCASSRSMRASSRRGSSRPSGVPGVFATLDAGRQETLGDLFHVRRQALRPGRMGLAAARGADGRPARARARRWSAAARSTRRVRKRPSSPRCTRSTPRGQAAGQSRAGRRGRGGDRLAQLPADRSPTPRSRAALARRSGSSSRRRASRATGAVTSSSAPRA